MRLSDENLRGRAVVAADGQVIGEVYPMLLTPNNGRWSPYGSNCVRTLLSNSVRRTIFHAAVIEVPVQMIQSVGDAIVLSVAAVGLRQVLPT